MPEVFRFRGFRFFFFSNEGSPREKIHIHVRKGEKLAKFWLEPSIRLAEAYGMNPRELNDILRIVDKNK